MKPTVAIIDYGMGNLLSVCRAVDHCGGAPVVVRDSAGVTSAQRLILPGVGAFKDGMNELNKRGLTDPLHNYYASGRPFLGICLGMQMMMESSEEFGRHEGLGLLSGTVTAIPIHSDGVVRKIPHIGWNTLHPPAHRSWKGSLFESLVPMKSSAYFVHSYAVRPSDSEHVLAESTYDGHTFVAAVAADFFPAYGCQFHPEKSGPEGLSILRTFILRAV